MGIATLNMSQDGSRWLWALEAEHKLEAPRIQGRACGDQKRRWSLSDRSVWVLGWEVELVVVRMGDGACRCHDGGGIL